MNLIIGLLPPMLTLALTLTQHLWYKLHLLRQLAQDELILTHPLPDRCCTGGPAAESNGKVALDGIGYCPGSGEGPVLDMVGDAEVDPVVFLNPTAEVLIL